MRAEQAQDKLEQSRIPLKLRFDYAAALVATLMTEHKNINPLSGSNMLTLYKFYKQARDGDCSTPQPTFFSGTKRQQWIAWNSVIGTSANDAMQAYIDCCKKLLSEHKQLVDSRNLFSAFDDGGPKSNLVPRLASNRFNFDPPPDTTQVKPPRYPR